MECECGSAVLAGADECGHSFADLGREADVELMHATVFVPVHEFIQDIEVAGLSDGKNRGSF